MNNEIFSREQAKASDKELYEAMLVVANKQQRVESAINAVHWAIDDDYNRRYDSRSGWKLSDVQAQDKLAAMIETAPAYRVDEYRSTLNKVAEANAELAQAREARRAADKWAEHGMWNRYAVVPGGHIHTDDHSCHTLRLTTDVRWAYPVSGDTVEDAIETYGAALCTHCYPDAPVEKTSDRIEMDAEGNPMTKAEAQAIRDARKAEKDAKAAAKNAKRVFDADGNNIGTDVSVRNEIFRYLEDIRYYGDGTGYGTGPFTRGELVSRYVGALAAKRGVDAEELMAEFKAKDAKKARRN